MNKMMRCFVILLLSSYPFRISGFSQTHLRIQRKSNSLSNFPHPKSTIPPLTFPQPSSQLSALPSSFLTSSAAVTVSKATSVLSSLSSPIVSVSTLAFVVLVHEAGHFLAARSMNIDVEEFSVGVGPKLAGFTTHPKMENMEKKDGSSSTLSKIPSWKRKKSLESSSTQEETNNSIEFSLRAIPLGGYVRFPENYNRTEAMMNEYQALKDEEEEEKKAANLAKEQEDTQKLSPLQTISNLFRSSKDKEDERKRNEALRVQEERQKKQWWRRLVNAQSQTKTISKKTKSSPQKNQSPEIVYFDNPNLLQNRPWSQRAIVLVGGIVFNLLLAFSVYFGEVTVGKGLPRPMFEPGAIVRVVNSNTETLNSASYGILHVGDKIIGINGNPIPLERSSTALAQEGINNFISTIRATTPGESVSLSIIPPKSKEVKEVTVVPRAPIDPQTGKAVSPLSIGVSLTPNYIETKLIRANSIPEAFQLAGTALTDITTDTASTISKALSSMVFSSSGSSSSELNGPIGVIRMGSSVASESNFDVGAIAAFAAAISVNLAVVNALPLPALDGGQLVFVLLEGLVGRKVVDQKLEETINAYCLILILLFSLSTTIGDIGNIIIGR